MKLQKQPNRWSCLPTSFAMLLDVDVHEIFNYLGHDGSEVIWPDHPIQYRHRGFHIQEMYHFALSKGHTVTPYGPKIGQHPPGMEREATFVIKDERLIELLHFYNGVLTGRTENGSHHALAYFGNSYFDPTSGERYDRPFYLDTFQLVHPI